MHLFMSGIFKGILWVLSSFQTDRNVNNMIWKDLGLCFFLLCSKVAVLSGFSVCAFADMLTDNYLLFLEITLTAGRASLGL